MDWKIQAELIFLAPFAVLLLVGVAIEAGRMRAIAKGRGGQ